MKEVAGMIPREMPIISAYEALGQFYGRQKQWTHAVFCFKRQLELAWAAPNLA